MDKCKTIAICNQKGGVGKTTTALNLGAGLSREGRRVLLIDSDPQSDLTASAGIEADSIEKSLGRLMYLATENYKPDVKDTIIHHEEGRSIFTYDGECKPAKAYEALTKEVIADAERKRKRDKAAITR